MRKLLSFIVLTAAVLLSAATAGCSGTPQEEVAKQAMEDLKNGDAESYVAISIQTTHRYAQKVLDRIDKRHNGIKSYKLIGNVANPDNEDIWYVGFEITNGKDETFEGDITIMKKDGKYLVKELGRWCK